MRGRKEIQEELSLGDSPGHIRVSLRKLRKSALALGASYLLFPF